MVKERAKGLIGHPNDSWPPLAPETLKRKDGVNTPLLETGEMRDSIEHVVADSSHGYVGSNDDKAVWQELGTSRGIPPRSFIGLAAHLEGPNVAKVAGKTLVAAIGAGLAGRRVHEFFEIAHIAAEAFHKVGETASDLLDSRRRGESMTTPAEFLPRVLATVADLALILAHTPRDRQEAFLEEFAANVKAQWRELFSPVLSAEDVDGMVADVIERVRAKRDQIEAAGAGTA